MIFVDILCNVLKVFDSQTNIVLKQKENLYLFILMLGKRQE